MKILAIETSCDDTGIAILEIKGTKVPDFEVLSNIVSSQVEIHKKYGGVFPMMAKREHQNNLVPVLKEALQKSKLLKIQKNKSQVIDGRRLLEIEKILEKEKYLFTQLEKFLKKYENPKTYSEPSRKIDLIAVTNGPGLEPCLWVGVNFAKALSYFWNIPIIPINHIEAHILVNYLENPKIDLPAISLIVSGGHTQLILMKEIGNYKIIGETRDDAAGECFDKAAKILGLEYPGGPAISKIASNLARSDLVNTLQGRTLQKLQKTPTRLPRPMINTKDYDFSFSGLKTAILYATRKKTLTKQYIQEMCVEIQQAIIDVLIKKTMNAAKNYKVKTIILGGGVSANQELRKQFKEKIEKEVYPNYHGRENQGIKVIFPEKNLSTDNALMIAVTGYFHRTKSLTWQKLKANSNLRVSK